MGFTDQLRSIGKDFPNARKEPFKGHKLADQIRTDWPASIKDLLEKQRVDQYKFDSSPGLGQWSEAPWLAVLHPAVTSTAMAGFYPVYLFEPGFQTVCLVLGQGAQKLTEALGKKIALEELAKRATLLRARGGEWTLQGFNDGPFQTLKATSVAKPSTSRKDPWSVSVAFGKRYQLAELPTDRVMADDLVKMLDLYDEMAKQTDLLFAPLDEELVDLKDSGELPSKSLDGAIKVIEHRKFEKRHRNRALIAKAKKKLGDKCQACSFSFSSVYGSYMKGFIEAHHKVPISTLPAAGAVLTPTEDDFMVLCSNCHRAIHRAGCPDLETFKNESGLHMASANGV